MKKILKLITLLFIFLSALPVYASTNTTPRTDDDLLVPDKVTVTDSNKSSILSTPAIDASEKVYDFADLFSDEEEEKLYNEVINFIDGYNMDLAIVTIDKNIKSSETVYADDFYDYNDFREDGVLFLIDMDNRQIHMTTSGSAINMYNDYRIDTALDAVYTYMSDEAYYEGTSKYITKISDYAKEGVPTQSSDSMSKQEALTVKLITSLIISLVVTLIVMVILIYKNKLVRKATTAKEYLNKDKMEIKHTLDKFVRSHTVKHEIDHSSSGGGSSTHSGSSGISHGGGSHKF